ncbi:MAG: ribonuclease P protein component [Cyanobacteria bacterium J06626_23]
MALPKRHRLQSSRSFSQVYKRGQKAHARCLVARALAPQPSSSANSRPETAAKTSAESGNSSAQLLKAQSPKTDSKRVPDRGDFALASTRFGISISRKVSKKAVVRNHIKRQIRAALLALMPQVRGGRWVVITVRSTAVTCEYDDFLRELRKVLTALEVLHGD